MIDEGYLDDCDKAWLKSKLCGRLNDKEAVFLL